MSFMSFIHNPDTRDARRAFLGQSGLLLSGAAVALMAGRDALAKGQDAGASDVRILNTALGAELEAIAAYQLGAASGLLAKPLIDLAVVFMGLHKANHALFSKNY